MKQLPQLYSQRDPRWANQRLGTVDGTTINGYGCYITCFAMLATYYGHEVTPGMLDDLFTNNGWYADGNLLTDDSLTKAYPDIVYQKSIDYSNSPADLNHLKELLGDPLIMVVLEVDFNPELQGLQSHFVVAVDCDGGSVQIADPWTGTVRDCSVYGYTKTTIQKFVVYQGMPVAVSTASELNQCIADRDVNWNLVSALFLALLIPLDASDKEGSKQKGVQAINDLKKHHDQDSQTIIDLKNELSTVNAEDRNYAQAALDAEHQRDSALANLNDLYKALNTVNQQEALQSILTLRTPHDQVVKHYADLLTILEDFIYKKVPKQGKSFAEKLWEWFR